MWNKRDMLSQRAGKSLVEILVVIFLITSILGMLTVWLRTLYHEERQTRRQAELCQTIQRLSFDFRRDLHRAAYVPLDGQDTVDLSEQPLLLDQNNEQIVEYRLAKEGIVREVRGREQAVDHELYRLASSAEVQWSVLPHGAGRIVQLMLTLPASGLAAVNEEPDVWHIESALGRESSVLPSSVVSDSEE